MSNEQFEAAVKNLHKAGFKSFEIETYMMMGLPGQSLSEVRHDVDYVFDNGASPVLTAYSPTPGSYYFNKFYKDKLTDPLMHNSTIFCLQTDEFDEEDVRLFRRQVKERKAALYRIQ